MKIETISQICIYGLSLINLVVKTLSQMLTEGEGILVGYCDELHAFDICVTAKEFTL